MATEHVTDHVARAIARLPHQFRGKTNVEALLSGLVGPCQDLEDALWALLVERDIDTAVGQQLDDIGLIVGEARDGRDDDEYRRFVRARISVNKSKGTAADILTVASLVLDLDYTDATFDLEFHELGFVLRILDTTITDELAELFAVRFLRKTRAAGVKGVFESSGGAAPADLLVLDSGALDTKKLGNATA